MNVVNTEILQHGGWLITADMHLTDAPQDEYRFGLFEFLAGHAKQTFAEAIIVLGDVTDRKDRHSGEFISRLADGFRKLADTAPVYVLQGNHDYTDPNYPTLGFLNHQAGGKHPITWITGVTPRNIDIDTVTASFIPFCRDQADFEAAVRESDANFGESKARRVMLFHQTFTGAKAASHVVLRGVDYETLTKCRAQRFLSGDIHIAQRVGCVDYIGAPYRIRFGDKYDGHVIHYHPQTDSMTGLRYACLQKHLLVAEPAHGEIKAQLSTDFAYVNAGDQVKFRWVLTREQFAEWAILKREVVEFAEDKGWSLYGVEIVEKEPDVPKGNDSRKSERADAGAMTSTAIFDEFCAQEQVPENTVKYGRGFLT